MGLKIGKLIVGGNEAVTIIGRLAKSITMQTIVPTFAKVLIS
jgi:hypothetical protein